LEQQQVATAGAATEHRQLQQKQQHSSSSSSSSTRDKLRAILMRGSVLKAPISKRQRVADDAAEHEVAADADDAVNADAATITEFADYADDEVAAMSTEVPLDAVSS
jgi:hypothetical protein